MTSLIGTEELVGPLSAEGIARSTVSGAPLAADELNRVDAFWRACKYLALGMIYLQANPLLREPLKPAEPALPHATVFPSVSVIVTIVLLKEAKICTCPEDKERLVFFAPAVRRVERTL